MRSQALNDWLRLLRCSCSLTTATSDSPQLATACDSTRMQKLGGCGLATCEQQQ
jgi:hypothetical protein